MLINEVQQIFGRYEKQNETFSFLIYRPSNIHLTISQRITVNLTMDNYKSGMT